MDSKDLEDQFEELFSDVSSEPEGGEDEPLLAEVVASLLEGESEAELEAAAKPVTVEPIAVEPMRAEPPVLEPTTVEPPATEPSMVEPFLAIPAEPEEADEPADEPADEAPTDDDTASLVSLGDMG